MSMQTRASASMFLLIAVVCAAGAAATAWQVREISHLTDKHALDGVHALQGFAEDSRRRELELKSAILASNPGFVGYVSQALAAGTESGGVIDAASIRDLLEERRKQYGFDVAAVLDPRGRSVVMLGDTLRAEPDFSATPLLGKVRAGSSAAIDLWSQDGKLVLVSLAPMLRGDTIEALLLTGTEIGSGFLAPIAQAARVDLALVGIGPTGNTVVASTLDASANEAILDAVAADPAAFSQGAPAEAPDVYEIALGGDATSASTNPLFGSAASGVLVSIVPVADRVINIGAVRTPMLVAGAGVLVVLLALWVLLQRRYVRPLTHLVEMSERVLGGDIQVIARDPGTGEISTIVSAFNQALAGLRGYKEVIERRGDKS